MVKWDTSQIPKIRDSPGKKLADGPYIDPTLNLVTMHFINLFNNIFCSILSIPTKVSNTSQ